jgi:hypothetical protein
MFPSSLAKLPRSLVRIKTLHSREDWSFLFNLLPSLIFEDVKDDMISSSIFTSSRLPSSTLDKRLQIGTFTIYDTEDTTAGLRFVPTTYDTYICIVGGEAMNQIVLTYGSANVKINVTTMTDVRFDEPFCKIDGDMTGESAKKKLRALGCSLFLAAGYLEGFEEYSGFFTSLQKACAWIKNDGRPCLMPPPVPLADIQYNRQELRADPSEIERYDDPQDDDEFIKVQEYEDPVTPSSWTSPSILGSISQVQLKSPAVDVFGELRPSSQG